MALSILLNPSQKVLIFFPADCVTPFPSCDPTVPTGNRKHILPRRDHWQRLQRTSGECSGSTTPPLLLCSPSLEKWAGYAYTYFLPFFGTITSLPWLQNTKAHITKQLSTHRFSHENISFRGVDTAWTEQKNSGNEHNEASIWEECCGSLWYSIFFTPYRKNATNTGQQRGRPDTSTLWWTPWQSITCPSISWESSKWLMPG